MRIRELAILAVIGVGIGGFAPAAFAEEDISVKGDARFITFGDSGARFEVVNHDRTAGAMTFRLASDSKVRITQAPTVSINTDAGPKDVTLVAVDGQPNTWRLSHAVLREERFDGTMKILVDGRTFDAPLRPIAVTSTETTTTKVVARHGGRVISFPDCGGDVEIVQDAATGTLTVYSLMGSDVKIVDAPVITVTETAGPRTLTLTKIDGEVVAWKVSNPVFKTTTWSNARIKVVVDGKPCEAALVTTAGATRGGQIITVEGGPRWEVVRDERAGAYTFYAIDETINGRPVVFEQPPVVVLNSPSGPREVVLTAVPNEPRAYRLVGVDGGITRPLDGRLRFSLFGRSLEANLGVSGAGVNLR